MFDLQNRVMILENSTGVVTHVWKGYHHAQFGWIHTMKDKDNPDPGNSEFAILLVIYLPRRGLLEVWSPDQKSRFVILYKLTHGLFDIYIFWILILRHFKFSYFEF